VRNANRLLILALLLAGCSGSDRPPLAKVSGIVTLDKTPVEGAAVMFMPVAGGRPAQGLTDAQGKFTLTTFDDGDGAILGEHKVTVTKVQITGAKATADGLSGTTEAGQIKEVWIVPQRYSVPETSKLTAKVEKGMQPVPLELSTSE
jgi:hypothetical protein